MDAGARNAALSALLLGLFAMVGTGLVALTHALTRERIAASERAVLERALHAVMPPWRHDNDLLADRIAVTDPELLGTRRPVTVYRARRGGRPVGVVLTPEAPDGYNGRIRLIVGIYADGTLAGVRVLAHQETPGLGDAIEAEKSDWILGFTGKSLGKPPLERWRVRRDGGDFDQFTGATITPRAVVKAVRNALIYFRHHREALFAAPASGEGEEEAS